jgi:glucose-fructose oxidoreductase
MKRGKKIRYAVVGLGHLAQAAILPAFKHSKWSELGVLVSGDPVKGPALSEKYHVPSYGYDEFEDALAKERIQAAFIVLPNTQHRRFT